MEGLTNKEEEQHEKEQQEEMPTTLDGFLMKK
jgi:hypothetical protein